jgi:hypothetical protein
MLIKDITVIIQIILQCISIFFALYSAKRFLKNGNRIVWYWLSGGFAFQIIRRILYFLMSHNISFPFIKETTFLVVPTCVSICFTIGMINLYYYILWKNKRMDENIRKVTEMRERLGYDS